MYVLSFTTSSGVAPAAGSSRRTPSYAAHACVLRSSPRHLEARSFESNPTQGVRPPRAIQRDDPVVGDRERLRRWRACRTDVVARAFQARDGGPERAALGRCTKPSRATYLIPETSSIEG